MQPITILVRVSFRKITKTISIRQILFCLSVWKLYFNLGSNVLYMHVRNVPTECNTRLPWSTTNQKTGKPLLGFLAHLKSVTKTRNGERKSSTGNRKLKLKSPVSKSITHYLLCSPLVRYPLPQPRCPLPVPHFLRNTHKKGSEKSLIGTFFCETVAWLVG